MQERVCVCVSLTRCGALLLNLCVLLQWRHIVTAVQPCSTARAPHRPTQAASWLPQTCRKTTVWAGSYCGDSARGKTQSEVGMQRKKRNKKKNSKKGWGDERLSHGVKKRSLRWSSVEEEATWKWLCWSGQRDKWREFQQKNEVMMVMRSYCLLCLPMMADTHTRMHTPCIRQVGHVA